MKIDFKRIESFIPNRIPESIREFNPELRLFKDDILECWYAPLGRINKKAKIALYGITPGWTQMKMAYQISINNKLSWRRNDSGGHHDPRPQQQKNFSPGKVNYTSISASKCTRPKPHV